MDLRVLKTKKNIRDAFLELRKKYSLDEIKVNALCEKAMVNKTTFYNHYQDIYELSEELEAEVLDDFLANFKDIDMMLTDAERCINGMHAGGSSSHLPECARYYWRLRLLGKAAEPHRIRWRRVLP